ncbi:MarR family winged helix-turn-helix transcriptional regulator [Methanosarcina barkeri]|uniref:HTH marR-type domain-containing protein n=1 Tax=Methanosarcina barkeri (strain Fusaro / DSM 804) TaxID=269797 RepID=Q468V0_METBF|nr:MarR family transcriptional regulator [Methanosarcina barkeri]
MQNQNVIQLYNTLNRLSRQMHRFSHRAEHKRGLFFGQSKLLQLISKNEGIIQRDLAEQMDMRPSSMTEALGRLEQLNLILRKRDEKDQRTMHIYLTNKGREIVEDAVRSEEVFIKKFTDIVFKEISEEELEKMLAITSKLCKSLDTLDSKESKDRDEECCQ